MGSMKLTLWSTKLLQVEVEHSCKSANKFWSQEGLLDVYGKVVEHVHRLLGKGQVRAALALILHQLPLARLLLLLGLLTPRFCLSHCLLNLVDTLIHKTTISQERISANNHLAF